MKEGKRLGREGEEKKGEVLGWPFECLSFSHVCTIGETYTSFITEFEILFLLLGIYNQTELNRRQQQQQQQLNNYIYIYMYIDRYRIKENPAQ